MTSLPANLGIVDIGVANERRRALRALLQHPLLVADGAQKPDFALVRRHQEYLREWFARHPQWRLRVSSELARLYKTAANTADGTRAAVDPHHALPFTRTRYAILCLALAAIERADRQTTLGTVAKQIETAAADPVFSGTPAIDFQQHDRRRDLVHVIRWLLDQRALVRVHGDERQYLDGHGDALYDVRRPVFASMLSVLRGPSTVDADTLVERIAAITATPALDTDDGRNRRLRSQITRRLLDDPVTYYVDLDADERAYLTGQRGHLLRQLEEATGLRAELRKEGIAMVDESGELSDVGLPEEGTEGHLALLLAEHLAEHLREHPDGATVGIESLRAFAARLAIAHRSHWRKDATQPGAEVELVDRTLHRLHALGLVRRVSGGVIPLPAVARYAIGEAKCIDHEASGESS